MGCSGSLKPNTSPGAPPTSVPDAGIVALGQTKNEGLKGDEKDLGVFAIVCEYMTLPAAKTEYEMTETLTRSRVSKQKIDSYSGSVSVSGALGKKVSAAVSANWSMCHDLSLSTENEEYTRGETLKQYYEGVTLLKRKTKFSYTIGKVGMQIVEEETVAKAEKPYSPDDLYQLALDYMTRYWGAVKEPSIEFQIELEKPQLETKWVPAEAGDDLPVGAVYAGATGTDGAVYIGRFNNTPGKVNLNNKKIAGFWVQHEGNRKKGEVLVTNGVCTWKPINRGDAIPSNAVYSGLDFEFVNVWVGRDRSTEPGKITIIDNKYKAPKMDKIWCDHDGSSSWASILLIDPPN